MSGISSASTAADFASSSAISLPEIFAFPGKLLKLPLRL